MLSRIAIITLNTYREAVRARVLHGLFALAVATLGYSLVVGAFTLGSNMRVVSDLGSASISLYAVIVAIVLGASSLYRELELKTAFPILARPVHRWEYVTGKYLGTVLTLLVFIMANAGVLLLSLAHLSGRSLWSVLAAGLGSIALFGVWAMRAGRFRTQLTVPWAFSLLILGVWLAADAPDDRRVVVHSAILTLCEVCIVAGIATVFAAFSSPFLTAVFTLSLFVVGRSADTLAHLPSRVFGATLQKTGEALSQVLPNLMLYVPPRSLLTGESVQVDLTRYTAWAVVHALAWSVGLIVVSSLVFRRRDFN